MVPVALFDFNSALRKAVLDRLGIDDDGSASFEIGRPETGATAVLVDDGGVLTLHVPLLRTPTSARDLLGQGLAWQCRGRPVGEDPIASWDALHVEACVAAGSLPHLPRDDLERLHGWLLAVARTPGAAGPILALTDGDAVEPCVALPNGPALLPPVPIALQSLRAIPMSACGSPRADGFIAFDGVPREMGEPLGDRRLISPVEIVDDESLFAHLDRG